MKGLAGGARVIAGSPARRFFRRDGAAQHQLPVARARELEEEIILVCLSGRGDKDLAEVLAR